MGKVMAYGGLPFLGIGCPAPELGITNLIFLDQEFDNLRWTSFSADSRNVHTIISKNVPSLATDSPFETMDEPFPPCGGPLKGLQDLFGLKMTVGV